MDRSNQESLLEYAQKCNAGGDSVNAFIALKEASRKAQLPDSCRALNDDLFNAVKSDSSVEDYLERIGECLPERNSKPKKYLLITNIFPPQQLGGVELIMWELSVELLRRGHELKVLCADFPYLHKEPEVGQVSLEENVSRELQSYTEWRGSFAPISDLVEVSRRVFNTHRIIIDRLEEYQPDCVLLGNIMTLLRTATLTEITNRKIPTLHVIGTDGTGYHYNAPVLSPWHRFMPCSNWLGKRLEQRGFVFYPPITLYSGGGLDKYYRHFPPRFDKLRIVFAGQVSEDKGIRVLIKALIELHEQGINYECIVAGSSDNDLELKEELLNQLHESAAADKVYFIGWQSGAALSEIFEQSNTFVFPSVIDDAFGRTAAEAMASGLVVLSSGTGGQREIIEDGISGLIFANQNSSDLAEKLKSLLDNPERWKEMARTGQERSSRFNTVALVDIIEQTSEKVRVFNNYNAPEPSASKQRREKTVSVIEVCNRALQLFQAGNKEEGQKVLDSVYDIGCQTPEYFYGVGLCYFMIGDWEKAHLEFINAIIISPGFWASYFYIGLGHARNDNYQDASYYFEWAAELNKTEPAIRIELAKVYDSLGKTYEAAELRDSAKQMS